MTFAKRTMAEHFDPYYTWLGIPPEEQPPDHYRLLGVRRFEANDDVIANAADQRMAYVRTFQAGKRSKQSQGLLNEIAAARGCLLDAQKRAAYDAELRDRIATTAEMSGSTAVLPVDALTPVLPVAVPMVPDQLPPLAQLPHATPAAHWTPTLPSGAPPPPPPAASPASPLADVDAETRGPVLSLATAHHASTKRPRVSLAMALVVGGGSFAVGLITLVATLLWAASQ